MSLIAEKAGGWKPYVLVAVLCALCCLTFSPLVSGIGYDREVFRYEGMLLSRGGVPYRNAFDHKPPLIYFAAFPGHLLHIGAWGYWVMMTGMATLAACLIYRAAATRLNPAAAWFLAGAWSFLISFEYLAADMGNTRLCAASMAVCCASLFFFAKGRRLYVGQGLFAAMVFWFQQNEVLPVLPVLLFSLMAPHAGRFALGVPAKTFFLRSVLMLAGALCVTLPIFLFFGWHGATADFIDQAFVFNFTEYRSPLPFSGKLQRTVSSFFTGQYSNRLGWLFLLSWLSVLVLTMVRKGPSRIAGVFLLLTGTLQLAAACISGFSALPYFLSFASCTLLLLAYLAAALRQPFLPAAGRTAIVGVLAATAGMLVLNKAYHVRSVLRSEEPQGFHLDPTLLNELRQVQGQDYQLYAFRSAQSLAYNTALDIKAPTRWIYTHFYGDLPGWDPNGDHIDEIMAALDRHRCRYLIDYSQNIPLPAHLQQRWAAYVRVHYLPVMPVKMLRYNGTLYKRNSPAGAELR